MAYNPELLKQFLGEQVADLFDGTVTIEPAKPAKPAIYGNLQIGDALTFNFKNSNSELRQFKIIK